MSNSKLVYSTDKTLTNLDESVDVVSVRASEQKVRLHLDRKKGGKVVTLIKGLMEEKDTIIVISHIGRPNGRKRYSNGNNKRIKEEVWHRWFR